MTALLEISTFGGLAIKLAGAPIAKLASRKADALLVYLACTRQPQAREVLADLLWDDRPQDQAMANLRVLLTSLRQTLGPYVTITRREVTFNGESPHRLDVAEFEQGLATMRQRQGRGGSLSLEDAAPFAQLLELYQGDFLQGFYPHRCRGFEEWQAAERERLRLQAIEALHDLVTIYRDLGEYPAGIDQARRLLQLDPLREEAHRQLMQLYAWTDQRPAAVQQYQECVRILDMELGILPSAETSALYETIKAGSLPAPAVATAVSKRLQDTAAPTTTPARFLDSKLEQSGPAAPLVAREPELAKLRRALEAALAKQGQVVFVTGEAGSGKTALIHEFARQAQETIGELLVVLGNCNAHTGLGDPYLPWRDVLDLLTGDIEATWARGLITRENASRLWTVLPVSIQAVLDFGPALIDTFISEAALTTRTTAGEGLVDRDQLRPQIDRSAGGTQSNLFEQFSNVLQSIARQRPLLLVIDDAQWADVASLSLMFHLGRRLAGSRILLVVTYRPEDVALGRPSTSSGQRERHPLEPVVNEFERIYGDIQVDLDRAMNRRFVEAYLDTQANQLGSTFRTALYDLTQGHPLFTVELWREMQARGVVIRDAQGRWVEGGGLDWNTLPARVEAVIKERVERLEQGLRDTLTVASVVGETFAAQVVAQVMGAPERLILQQLSQELSARHHLVHEQGEDKLGRRFLSRFRFTHLLFQQYLYQALGVAQKRLLHGEVALALENIFDGQSEEMTVHLARHYAEAGQGEKAAAYLLQAGDRARAVYAQREAISHYRQALTFLREKGDYEAAARTYLKLGLTYHNAFDFNHARQAYDEGFTLWQQSGVIEADTPLPPAPHALRLAWGEPVTLDPTMSEDNNSAGIIFHLFSGLVEQRPEMEVIPDVARSWEVLSAGHRYLFHLRDDVRWSDGVPVTAGDFEYAWKRVLDPNVGSPNARLLHDIKGARAFQQGEASDPDHLGVRAVDEVTLMVELEEPTGHFPNLLTSTATYPVPRHVVERQGQAWTDAERIVTNGPFRLKSWDPGQLMVLVRNSEYHGRYAGNVEQVELSLFSDLSALALYEADALDLFYNLWTLPVNEWNPILYRHAGEHISLPELATHFLRFDVSRPPFSDPRVRRAFVLAIDRDALANVVLQGFVSPATGGFIPAGMPGHMAGIGLPYDVDRARQLMAEAGYPDGHGFPAVEAVAPRGREPWCQYLQDQWQAKLGITITWESLAWTEFLARLNSTSPPLAINGWVADYPDPDDFLRVGVPLAEIGWQNEAYDRLLEDARQVTDQEERMRLYRQADTILIEEAAITPLIYRRFHMLVKPWVKKYPTSANRYSFWKDVVIEAH